MNKGFAFIFVLGITACGNKADTIKPRIAAITESVYASGTVKSQHQYQAFAPVTGVIQDIFVAEGDSVHKGTPLLSVANEAQRLNRDNAALAASFADMDANRGKLREAEQNIELAYHKAKVDSALWVRQQNLWQQNIGSKVELEQRELAYQSSKTQWLSARVRYDDLKRQLQLNAAQSQKSYQISSRLAEDFTLRSEVDGIVYSMLKKKGELVTPQTPLAVVGAAGDFILEMQVDEYDILKVQKGMKVLVTMDSYKGKVFDAVLTKIDPLMNEKSKTFLVEAQFVQAPPQLYPNVSFEANIILQTKDKALLIPRNYLLNDSFVLKADNQKVAVRTGLKDYKMVEILSGIAEQDELKKPTP